jgi:cell division septum initiation protein DivIVA
MEWHRAEVRTAVSKQAQELAAETEALEETIAGLKQKLEKTTEPEATPKQAAAERIEKVFGEPPEKPPVSTMAAMDTPSCYRLEKKINAFFSYLDQRGFVEAAGIDAEGARRVFEDMVAALSAKPPLIIGETQDIVSLMHNQAHFFRTLDEKRIALIKHIMQTEADVLEHAMLNFYDYYVKLGGCGGQGEAIVSLEPLYEYASFFLNTLSGKSYLLRRDSTIRCLTRYYSVLVLDQANKATLNRYGIDIRPHIKLSLDDIRHQNALIYQDIYLERLAGLQEKYQ